MIMRLALFIGVFVCIVYVDACDLVWNVHIKPHEPFPYRIVNDSSAFSLILTGDSNTLACEGQLFTISTASNTTYSIELFYEPKSTLQMALTRGSVDLQLSHKIEALLINPACIGGQLQISGSKDTRWGLKEHSTADFETSPVEWRTTQQAWIPNICRGKYTLGVSSGREILLRYNGVPMTFNTTHSKGPISYFELDFDFDSHRLTSVAGPRKVNEEFGLIRFVPRIAWNVASGSFHWAGANEYSDEIISEGMFPLYSSHINQSRILRITSDKRGQKVYVYINGTWITNLDFPQDNNGLVVALDRHNTVTGYGVSSIQLRTPFEDQSKRLQSFSVVDKTTGNAYSDFWETRFIYQEDMEMIEIHECPLFSLQDRELLVTSSEKDGDFVVRIGDQQVYQDCEFNATRGPMTVLIRDTFNVTCSFAIEDSPPIDDGGSIPVTPYTRISSFWIAMTVVAGLVVVGIIVYLSRVALNSTKRMYYLIN